MICSNCFHLESYHDESGCRFVFVDEHRVGWTCSCMTFVGAAVKEDNDDGS